VRHFDKLLNGDPATKETNNEGGVQRNVQEFEVREGEETEAPTLDEVGNALEKLKIIKPREQITCRPSC
jgi:hypothetical protein